MVEELREQLHGALNVKTDRICGEICEKLDNMSAELAALREEVKEVRGDWALCKEAALSKSQGPKATKWGRRPKAEGEELREARQVRKQGLGGEVLSM
ncbi:hypothetical protein ACLB2K_042984 [Fragaria x ananassa]